MNRNKCMLCNVKNQMNERIKEIFLYGEKKIDYTYIINKNIKPNCEGCLNYLDSITYYA